MKSIVKSFLFITAFFFSCLSESSSGNKPEQKLKELKTGCYPINTNLAGPGFYCKSDGLFYYLDTTAIIDINDIKETSVSKSTGKYLVNIVLKNDAVGKFTDATEKFIGKSIAFVIDNKLVMTPQINQKITGNSIMIDGSFTEDEMIKCYLQIKSELDNLKQ